MNAQTITWSEIRAVVQGDRPPSGTLGIDAGNGLQTWESLRHHEFQGWSVISSDDEQETAQLIADPEAADTFDLVDEARTLLYDLATFLTLDQWVLRAAHAPDVQDPEERPSLSHRIMWDNVNERRGIITTVDRVREDWPWCGRLVPAVSVTIWDDESVEWSGPGAR
jgi:hypothetical protein